jgi:hypothetical protein
VRKQLQYIKEKVKKFKDSVTTTNELGLVREKLTILGATGSATETCVIASAHLVIGDWSGNHSVVITDSLIDKDVVLGRDFLKKYNVTINHGTDEIHIDKPLNRNKLTDPICYVAERRELPSNTENVVKCHSNVISVFKEVLFSPSNNVDKVYWSNCVSKVNEDGDFFVKVINVTNENLVLDSGMRIGEVTEEFEVVKDSETFELKTINMSDSNRRVYQGVEEKLARLKFGKKITGSQEKKLKHLIERNMAAFQWSDDDVGRTDLLEHEIDTGNSKPIKQKQFKIPQAVQGILEEQIKDMVKNNLIEPSSSPWCSPMMIIKQKKRDGSFKHRFVCDMKGVNSVTVKDSFPLQRMDQALDQLGGAIHFSVVDMARGYFQVPLKKEDRSKTAFSANGKLWQWKVMCLGLCNAPSTFTRLMDLVLNGLTFVYCLVYLDDTIVYSRSFEEHLEHLEEIFKRLIKAGLKLNPDEVSYLGFIVTTVGIKPDPDKTKAINEMQFPKSPKEMLRFLGMANFYRDFIHKFSYIASPLYKMSQSKQKFKDQMKNDKVFKAFEQLKVCLMSEPVLTYPNWNLDFVVKTDAAGFTIGGVLGQNVDNKFKPIMYASRHLTAAETRYSTTERELLAVVFCTKRFKAYLYGRRCTFVVDHEPLVTMKKLKDPMGRLGNLLFKLQDCEYEMVYQPGNLHVTPDLLSRPSKSSELNSIEMQFQACVNWEQEQLVDCKLSKIVSLVKAKVDLVEKWSECASGSEWFKMKEELCMQEGVLMRKCDNKLKIVVPKQSVSVVLNFLHDEPLAGHRDFEKTYNAIKGKYFWLLMHKEIKDYCTSCHLCHTKKYLNKPSVAPLKPIVVNSPWSLIGLDIAGPLRVTPNNNKYVVIAVDYFTKFSVAKAIPNFTAVTTAIFVFEEIICKLGMPRAIISDKGVNFQSKLLEELCKLLGIKKLNSTFYHPEGVGMVERMVKIIKQILTMYINPTHTNWDNFLQSSMSAYNTHKQASIKISPYEALYAREPVKVADVLLATPIGEATRNVSEYVDNLKRSAAQIHAKMNEHLDSARAKQKQYYDREVKNLRQYRVGDLVGVVNERSLVGQSNAFKDRVLGPFKIIKTMNEGLNFEIVNQQGKTNKIHYNRLLPYKARSAEKFTFTKQVVKKPNGKVASANMDLRNSNEFDINIDLIMEVREKPTCEYCGAFFESNRQHSRHVNGVHSEIILNDLENIIEFVIRDIEELRSEPVVEAVVETTVEVEAEAVVEVEAVVEAEVVVEGEAAMDMDQASIVPQVSEYANCSICFKRFKRRGIHVHMRTHVVITELIETLVENVAVSAGDKHLNFKL